MDIFTVIFTRHSFFFGLNSAIKVLETSNSEKKEVDCSQKRNKYRNFDLKNGHFHSHFHKTFIFLLD
jgi:hypothetical protein